MPPYPHLIFGVLLPGLLAGVVLVGGWPPWRHVRIDSGRGLISVPLAMLVALLVCFVYAAGWWRLAPEVLWQRISSPQAWQRSIVLAVASTTLGVAAVIWRRPRRSIWVFGLALATLAVLVMRPPNDPEHPTLSRWALGVIVLALHWCLTPLARRRPGPTVPLGCLICFAAASIVLIETHYATFALLAASLSAACGAAVLVSLMTRQLNIARGGVAFVAAMLPTLLFVGAWYDNGDVPGACFVLLAMTPLLLWAGELRIARRRPAWQTATITAGIVAIMAGVAVVMSQTPHDS